MGAHIAPRSQGSKAWFNVGNARQAEVQLPSLCHCGSNFSGCQLSSSPSGHIHVGAEGEIPGAKRAGKAGYHGRSCQHHQHREDDKFEKVTTMPSKSGCPRKLNRHRHRGMNSQRAHEKWWLCGKLVVTPKLYALCHVCCAECWMGGWFLVAFLLWFDWQRRSFHKSKRMGARRTRL